MTVHLKMDDKVSRDRLDEMVQGVIGKPLDRPEGELKASGRAPYAMDTLPDGCCHGVLVRSTISKGTLTKLGKDAVLALPGIRTIVTDDRLTKNPAQGMAGEAPAQGPKDIIYFGQPIALVVADTFEQARHGAIALQARFEAHGEVARNPDDQQATIETPKKKQASQGDLEKAMREARFTVDESYTTPSHVSGAMEPHASVASWDGDQLTLHGSYQMLRFNRAELADALGVKEEKVRILAPYVGGGFGSKLGIAPEAVAAAIAAKELGVPVAVAMSRQNVFEMVLRRSETSQRIRLAADESGRLTGIGHEALVSNFV
jgi:xanthine dehydrogenase YagR molybdenum-binding subunit